MREQSSQSVLMGYNQYLLIFVDVSYDMILPKRHGSLHTIFHRFHLRQGIWMYNTVIFSIVDRMSEIVFFEAWASTNESIAPLLELLGT